MEEGGRGLGIVLSIVGGGRRLRICGFLWKLEKIAHGGFFVDDFVVCVVTVVVGATFGMSNSNIRMECKFPIKIRFKK